MLVFSSRKIITVLFRIAIICCVLGALGQSIEVLTGKENVLGLAAFDLNEEGTVSAWFSSMLLLSASALLGIIALARRELRFGRHWRWLAGIFLYLSLDEALSIHEEIKLARAVLDESNFLYGDAWVFVGAAFVAVVALSYRRFLLMLPSQIRVWMLTAGGLYVAGAVGMEIVGGYFDSLWGRETLIRVAAITIEEGLEMVGVICFIHSLLLCWREWNIGLRFQGSREDEPSATADFSEPETIRPVDQQV